MANRLVNVAREMFFDRGNYNGEVNQDVRAMSFGDLRGDRISVCVIVGATAAVMPFFGFAQSPERRCQVQGRDERVTRLYEASVHATSGLANPDAFCFVGRDVF